jgi:hypothetical protein
MCNSMPCKWRLAMCEGLNYICNFQSYNSILHLRSLSQSRIGLDSIACCISKGRVWSWSAWFCASWLSLIHRGGFARATKSKNMSCNKLSQTSKPILTKPPQRKAPTPCSSWTFWMRDETWATREPHPPPVEHPSARSQSIAPIYPARCQWVQQPRWETTKKLSEIIWIRVNSWRIKNSHTFQIQKG